MRQVATSAGNRGTPEGERPGRTVVVGFDGSPDSAAALPLAALDAALTSSTLHVLVSAPASPDTAGPVTPDPAAGPDGHQLPVTGAELLSRAGEQLHRTAPHLRTTGTVVAEPPTSALLAAAERADLVAIGARGVGHEFAPAWCEVAVELTEHAAGPVLVVRSGDTGATDAVADPLLGPPASDGRPARWPNRVVVALTGGPSDEVVFRTGVEFARRHDAPVEEIGADAADDLTPALNPADVLVTRIDGPAAVTGLVPGRRVQAAAARATCTVLAVPASMSAAGAPSATTAQEAEFGV